MAPKTRAVADIRGVIRPSLEEVLLTTGMVEQRPVRAYRRLLDSSVPQAGSTSPGGAEIAKMARVYWKAHAEKGERLPYFQPFEITELNIYANVSGCDFVIYRRVGRADLRCRKLQVVADTRLFSAGHEGTVARRCAHVALDNDGAWKLSESGLRRSAVIEMLPNVSTKDAIVIQRPIDLFAAVGAAPPSPQDARRLAKMSFADLRSDVRVLDGFTRALGRPLRLLAVGCTSRFRRTEARAPRAVKTQMVEQRSSRAGAALGDTVTLCLQARTAGDGGELVDAIYSPEWSSKLCGARKAGKASAEVAVSPKVSLRDAKADARAATPKKPKKERKPRPAKISSHVRLDPCCGPDPDDCCEACAQMMEEHAESRRPPVESSQFLYNPQKGGGSFLADARSLGVCDVFPWLEETIFRANLASCSAMDIETLNAPLAPGALSGVTSSLVGPDEVSGGTTALTRHVPFVIGTTSFMWRATRRWSVDELLWRLQGEATKYVEFRVEERDDVPGQSDVARMVESWLGYVETRRRVIAEQKRKVMAPLLDMLRAMEAASKKFEEENPLNTGRNPKFRYSVFGRLLVKAERWCEELKVITYNGSKFDLINILSPLIAAARRTKMKVDIGRKGERCASLPQSDTCRNPAILSGTEIRFLKVGGIVFYDLFKLSTEASLKKLGDMLNVSSRTRGGLEKEYCVPYTFFTRMSRLEEAVVPPLDHPSWMAMRDGSAMCTPEEHSAVVKRVEGSGCWWDLFSRYLRNDCDLTLACLVSMAEIYRSELGVDMLGPSFTSAGAVVAAHLEDATNSAAVQGFCEIKNGTVGRILLNARNGGIVESRVVQASKIWEREDPVDTAKVFCLDVNSLYPSVQAIHSNPYGEYTVYSPLDPKNPNDLVATSNFNPYGNEYKACAMLRHELEDRYGETVLSFRSNHSNQRIAVLPRYWPDSFAVSKRDGKVTLTFHQHDGYYHVLEPNLHAEDCKFYEGDNGFFNSPRYQLTMAAFERHRKYCEAVFSSRYELRFLQTTDCAFHSPYATAAGRTYANMKLALAGVRRRRPELCISAPHPSRMTVTEALSGAERADGSTLTGFAVIKASYDCKRHLGTSQFGFLVEASAITKDMLSPWTVGEIERVARLQTSDPNEATITLGKFYESLKKIRRLHMRNAHSRWVTITLDHARFLRSIGVEIEEVAHVVLFASLTRESQSAHPYRTTIERLLRGREDLQRELAALKRAASPTQEQKRRMTLLKTLIFVMKIR